MVFCCTFRLSQALVQKSIVRYNSDTGCAVDGAPLFVCGDCPWWCFVIQIHVVFRRVVSANQLTGTIPTPIAQLTALIYLYVAIVPGGVSLSIQIHVLRHRHLANNQLTGTIPTQIAQLTALSYLYVAIVDCPWCFVSVHMLLRRHLYNNRLIGQIPPLSLTIMDW
jgi:hypothetical protein